MKTIKVKAPAKINLTLEVLNRREDGFHDIRSIMHTINLYDYLTFSAEKADGIQIELSGNSSEIPYDEKNLVYKAVIKYLEKAEISDIKIVCYLEKNIPVEAGLAGGSTDAAAAFFALNKLFDNKLSEYEISRLCAMIGSDLNFCYRGGCAICSSRGEIIRPIPFVEKPVSLVKIKNFKISAKEAYNEFDRYEKKESDNYTDKLVKLIVRGDFDDRLLHNDLELPMCKKYNVINNMKKFNRNALMSGSGPTFFILSKNFYVDFEPDEFLVIENLQTTGKGAEEVIQ